MAFDVDRLSPSIVADIRPDRALFHETPMERIERWALGLAWAVRPQRIGGLPALGRLWLSDLVAPRRGLPDPERTLNAGGLCGMVHDLAVPTLIEAYERGLFTFAHLGPLKWVSPPERCVLYFDEAHIARRLRRQLRRGRYNVTFDRDFVGVIKACAGRRDRRWHVTWITPRIMRAYAAMFDAGYVHSFEVWNEAGALAGGGYGVAIGRVFFTESQFSREPNTSKIGFTVLNWHLATAAHAPGRNGGWHVETDLGTVAAWEPAGGAHRRRAAEAMGFRNPSAIRLCASPFQGRTSASTEIPRYRSSATWGPG